MWCIDNVHAISFKRSPFRCIIATTARDDGSGMSHLLVGRRGTSRDESCNWLLHRTCILRRLLFHSATDFADEGHGMGPLVAIQLFERIAGCCPDHRVAADANESRLAKVRAREIETDQGTEATAS